MSQKLILGTNFWKAFNIKPVIEDIFEIEEDCCTLDPILMHDLSTEQRENLNGIIENFNFGFTKLIEHEIDTGDAKPVKQKQYYQKK